MDQKDGLPTEATQPAPTPEFSDEYKQLHVRPWVRLFARLIDIYVFAIFLGVASSLFYPSLFTQNMILDQLLILFLWALIEPAFLSTFGSTFGKYLLNIKLRDLKGNKPNFFEAFVRSFKVWVLGFGFGLPIVSLFTFALAHVKLTKTGSTEWDRNNFIVTHSDIGYLRSFIAFSIIVLTLGLSVLGVLIEKHEKEMYSSPSTFSAEIEKENKNLPKKVDDETELTAMSLANNTLTYQYKLTKMDANTVDKSTFYDKIRNHLLVNACKNSSIKTILSLGYNTSFNYSDKNGLPIAEVLLKPSDCK